MKRSESTLIPVVFTLIVIWPLSICGCSSNKGARNAVSNLLNQNGYEKLVERQQAMMPEEPASAKKLPEMTAADYELLGDRYFDEGKFEMAYVQYSKVLEKKPDNPDILYKRGLIFLKRGMNESAQNEFQTILSKDPSNALAHQGMGQMLFKMRNYTEAQTHFQQAVKSNAKLWISHNFLGIIYDYQKQPQKAIEQYTAAIALKSDEANLYNNLGISYSMLGDYEKAVGCFRRGLQLSPKDAKTGNNLGMLLAKLGRDREALEAFRIGGDEAQAYNNLGSFYLQEKHHAKAARAFEKAIELRSGFYALANENLKKAEAALEAQMPPEKEEVPMPSASAGTPPGRIKHKKTPAHRIPKEATKQAGSNPENMAGPPSPAPEEATEQSESPPDIKETSLSPQPPSVSRTGYELH